MNKPEKYYVYVHYRPGDDIPFYIGKGCGNRAWSKFGRKNPLWHNIVKKNGGFDTRLLLENLEKTTALRMEAMYINAYGRRDQGKGPLANLTDGGEGGSGCKQSAETIAKRVSKLKGQKRNQEFRDRMRFLQLGKKHDPEWVENVKRTQRGRRPTTETLDKRSIAMKGKNTWAKGSITAHDPNKNITKKFKNIEEIPEGWKLGRVKGVKRGKRKNPMTATHIENNRQSHKKFKYTVFLNDVIIGEYFFAKDAGFSIGLKKSSFIQAAKRGYTSNGHIILREAL